MRFLHLIMICGLVFAAAHVYRIKMESTVRTEQVMKLRSDIREQRNVIAALRAEWAQLESPHRLQGLVERHMTLKPLEVSQYDYLKNLPERPPSIVKPGTADPIGAIIDKIDSIDHDVVTGSVGKQGGR
jgi:hypothetical protein